MINISLVFVRKSNSNIPDFSLLGLNNISNSSTEIKNNVFSLSTLYKL